MGPVALVAHNVVEGRVTTVGLQLAQPDPVPPKTVLGRIQAAGRLARMRLRHVTLRRPKP
jgi:hypothetical protein